MSGFQFGNTSATGTFGATPAPNTSFNFKSPSFGSAQTAPALPFGTPSSTAPAFGATNPTMNFGSPAPTAPTFGAQTTTPSMFGTPVTTNQPTGLFGTTSTSAPTTNLFGTPAPTATGPTLFSTPTTTAPATNLFGTGQPGQPNQTASSLFSTPTTSAPLTVFGCTPDPPSRFAASAPPNLLFGTATSTATPKLGLFGTSTSQPIVASVAPSLGLSFGTAATSTGFSFGTATSTTSGNQTIPSTGLSFGLGGTPGFNLEVKQTTQANVGLGGIAPVQQKSATSGKTELVPKEQTLPNELQQTVQSFKEFVKKQKSYSSDVARCSIKEFKKVESDIDSATNLLNEVEKQLQNNRAVAEKLKHDTANVLQNVEIAQRTFDTPPGLQYDNTSPLNFFMELADTFEKDMYALKLQIDNTDKYVKNLGKQTPLTSQDLTNGMRKLHETFVALAGRLQSVHSEVQMQKEQYLNLRKYMFHDDTNVFEKSLPQNEILNLENITFSPSKIAAAAGPTPFNSFMNSSVVQQIQAQNPPPPPYGSNQIGLKATSASAFGMPQTSATAMFGSTASNFGQSSGLFANTSNAFQLQQPPAGGKRKQ